VDIDGPSLVHIDGEVASLTGPVSVWIEPAALEFLI
jgi:hypothetical protein